MHEGIQKNCFVVQYIPDDEDAEVFPESFDLARVVALQLLVVRKLLSRCENIRWISDSAASVSHDNLGRRIRTR